MLCVFYFEPLLILKTMLSYKNDQVIMFESEAQYPHQVIKER
jgi:hypothetical protein